MEKSENALAADALATDGAAVVGCKGCTLMPGEIEGHADISFGSAANDSDHAGCLGRMRLHAPR